MDSPVKFSFPRFLQRFLALERTKTNIESLDDEYAVITTIIITNMNEYIEG